MACVCHELTHIRHECMFVVIMFIVYGLDTTHDRYNALFVDWNKVKSLL